MSARTGFEVSMFADRARFQAAMQFPIDSAPLPNPAEVAAAYRRTADLYAAHVKLMPAVW